MDELKEELIALEDFMEILNIGRTTAYHLLNSGEVKAFRIGRYWKIPRASVTEYVSRKSNLGFYT